MEQISFVFTVFFMLLGPIKLIPAFAGLTRGMDGPFKRSVAIRGAVIASVLCLFVALAGGILLGKYRISIDAVRISGGLVLLIAALQVIFQKAHSSSPGYIKNDFDVQKWAAPEFLEQAAKELINERWAKETGKKLPAKSVARMG